LLSYLLVQLTHFAHFFLYHGQQLKFDQFPLLLSQKLFLFPQLLLDELMQLGLSIDDVFLPNWQQFS
jgi:hypothetical protein